MENRKLRVKITRWDTWMTDEDGYFRKYDNKCVPLDEVVSVAEYNAKWYEYLQRKEAYDELSEEDRKWISFEEVIILKGDEILEDEKEEEAPKAIVCILKIVDGEPKVIQPK